MSVRDKVMLWSVFWFMFWCVFWLWTATAVSPVEHTIGLKCRKVMTDEPGEEPVFRYLLCEEIQ